MCQQERNHKSVESLELSLDRINSWISNCDQKAGFLLATIGIVLAILFATDFVGVVKKDIVEPFLCYLDMPKAFEFSLIRFLFFIVLMSSVITCAVSAIFALLAISATVDSKKQHVNNPTLSNYSYLFFQTISSGNFETYSKFEQVSYADDLMSQIYINSSICAKKFKSYKVALGSFYAVVISIAIMYVLYLFV